MHSLRVALAQINTTVGDLAGNADRIIEAARRADALGADVVAFPELALTGYPPEDLLLRAAFIDAAAEALRDLADRTNDLPPLIVSCIELDRQLYNAAAIVYDGCVLNFLGFICGNRHLVGIHVEAFGQSIRNKVIVAGSEEAVGPPIQKAIVFVADVDNKVAGFPIGLVLIFDIIAGGPLTGAAMNPARAFGPCQRVNANLALCTWPSMNLSWSSRQVPAQDLSVFQPYVYRPETGSMLRPLPDAVIVSSMPEVGCDGEQTTAWTRG